MSDFSADAAAEWAEALADGKLDHLYPSPTEHNSKLRYDPKLKNELMTLKGRDGKYVVSTLSDIHVLIDWVLALIEEHDRQVHSYQTHVGLIRTLNSGREIWGVRIAYEARQIIGDTAGSKEEAEEKLKKYLAELQSPTQKNSELKEETE